MGSLPAGHQISSRIDLRPATLRPQRSQDALRELPFSEESPAAEPPDCDSDSTTVTPHACSAQRQLNHTPVMSRGGVSHDNVSQDSATDNHDDGQAGCTPAVLHPVTDSARRGVSRDPE